LLHITRPLLIHLIRIKQTNKYPSARSENAILQQKVKELSAQVKILTVEKAVLEAEVELYRKEVSLPNFSKLALGAAGPAKGSSNSMDLDSPTNNNNNNNTNKAFLKSGNGVYCQIPEIVLHQLHDTSNPLCVAMSPDETVLVTGGADRSVHLVQWGAADVNNGSVPAQHSCSIADFAAPVICVAVAPSAHHKLIAAGGMDGTLALLQYNNNNNNTPNNGGSALTVKRIATSALISHRKYIKCVQWSSCSSRLATCSADGDIHVYTVEPTTTATMNDDDYEDNECSFQITLLRSLHLSGPVECLAFGADHLLLAHARGTAVLSEFDLSNDFALTEINLNTNHPDALNGGFEEHVSFTCLDLQVSPDGKFLALATDNHRHMILDNNSSSSATSLKYQQVRNLYGHCADGFSSPVLAWSANGQYLYCNEQNACQLTVYDIASSKIVGSDALQKQPHTRPIKALWSSPKTNTLVTTSFDRNTVVWFAPAE